MGEGWSLRICCTLRVLENKWNGVQSQHGDKSVLWRMKISPLFAKEGNIDYWLNCWMVSPFINYTDPESIRATGFWRPFQGLNSIWHIRIFNVEEQRTLSQCSHSSFDSIIHVKFFYDSSCFKRIINMLRRLYELKQSLSVIKGNDIFE